MAEDFLFLISWLISSMHPLYLHCFPLSPSFLSLFTVYSSVLVSLIWRLRLRSYLGISVFSFSTSCLQLDPTNVGEETFPVSFSMLTVRLRSSNRTSPCVAHPVWEQSRAPLRTCHGEWCQPTNALDMSIGRI